MAPTTKPPVIAVVNLKGGVAKSTSAMMLAFAASREFDRPSLVLDTDPSRGALRWAEDLESEDEVVVRKAELIQLARGWERWMKTEPAVVIIDTPPADHKMTAAAIQAADLALIPSQPGQIDVAQTADTLSLARSLNKPAVIVPTLVAVNTLEVSSFPSDLDSFNLPHTETQVMRRIEIQRAFGHSPTRVPEDYECLWSEVKELLAR